MDRESDRPARACSSEHDEIGPAPVGDDDEAFRRWMLEGRARLDRGAPRPPMLRDGLRARLS